MAPADLHDDPPDQPRIERLAAVLVAAGRVTPALDTDDPRLPAPLAATVVSSSEQVASWVRLAVAPGGDLRLALRCHEPADGRRRSGIAAPGGPAGGGQRR